MPVVETFLGIFPIFGPLCPYAVYPSRSPLHEDLPPQDQELYLICFFTHSKVNLILAFS